MTIIEIAESLGNLARKLADFSAGGQAHRVVRLDVADDLTALARRALTEDARRALTEDARRAPIEGAAPPSPSEPAPTASRGKPTPHHVKPGAPL